MQSETDWTAGPQWRVVVVFRGWKRSGSRFLRGLFGPSVRHGAGISRARRAARSLGSAKRHYQGVQLGVRPKSAGYTHARARSAFDHSVTGTKTRAAHQEVESVSCSSKFHAAP